MIVAPPQHGKSELASVRLPAYWLLLPDASVILTSYGADLAVSKSRQVRDIVVSDKFRALFGDLSPVDDPVELRADSRAVARWQLARRRGSLLAVGVGGPVTGTGTSLGVIDDPFENWEQAQSATQRNRVLGLVSGHVPPAHLGAWRDSADQHPLAYGRPRRAAAS